jgi:hypothetical protein
MDEMKNENKKKDLNEINKNNMRRINGMNNDIIDLDGENSYGRFSLPVENALKKNIQSNMNKNDHNKNRRFEHNQFCLLHNKALEAYCNTEKLLICINCILEKKHEGHIILSIEEACEKEKEDFIIFEEEIQNAERSITHQLNNIIKIEEDLMDFRDKNFSKISYFYFFIKEKIKEKEAKTKEFMKKQIEEEIEKINFIKEKINNLLTNDTMRIINDLNVIKISNFSKTDFLQNLKNISDKITLILSDAKHLDSNILKERFICLDSINTKIRFKPSEEIISLIKYIHEEKISSDYNDVFEQMSQSKDNSIQNPNNYLFDNKDNSSNFIFSLFLFKK